MAAYGVVRVSTNKQENSQEYQEDTINRWCANNDVELTTAVWGGETVGPFFKDDQSSKIPLAKRKNAGIMVRLLKPGDVVVATKLDRMFRSMKELAHYIDEWHKKDITIIFTDYPGVTIKTAWGRAMIQMLGVFAEFEREMCSERTAEGLHIRKKHGKRVTLNPKIGMKWVRSPDGDGFIQVENPELTPYIRQITKLHYQGYSVEQIFQYLNRQCKYKRPVQVMEKDKHGKNTGRFKIKLVEWGHSCIKSAIQTGKARFPGLREEAQAEIN